MDTTKTIKKQGLFLLACTLSLALFSFKSAVPNSTEETSNVAVSNTLNPTKMTALYQYLEENLEYPDYCAKNNVQGKSYISFTIDEEGTISDLEVAKSSHELLDQEAVRVLSEMPKNKMSVESKIRYTIPVNFVIE